MRVFAENEQVSQVFKKTVLNTNFAKTGTVSIINVIIKIKFAFNSSHIKISEGTS